MKKNKMMRFASLVLVLTLLSTCAISGTFAKYTSTAGSQDSARVANWGFDSVSMNIEDLFANAYVDQPTDQNSTVSASTDVIAPGTNNSVTFAFAYDEAAGNAPEVSYTFKVDTEGSDCDTTIQNNANIKWYLDDASKAKALSWTELLAAIEDLAGSTNNPATDGEATYAPGQLPEEFTTADDEHTIAWEWVFETDKTADEADTEMGNADALADVTLVINITATQIN